MKKILFVILVLAMLIVSTVSVGAAPRSLQAPLLQSPSQGQAINTLQSAFNWIPVAGASYYEIAIATDNGFVSIVESTSNITALPFTPAANLADGLYFWRVRTYDSSNVAGPWSFTRNFTLDTVPPDAPVNTSPVDGAILTATPTFRWSRPATAVYYEFQYDNDSDFSSPIYTASSVQSYRKPPKMNAGTYFWHARARDTAGNWGEWSAYFTVTIQ